LFQEKIVPKESSAKFDSEALSALIDRFDESIQLLRLVRDEMLEKKIKVLQIKNYAEMKRATKGLQNFAYAARDAFHQHREGEGVFVAPVEQLEQKIKTLEAELKKAHGRIEEMEERE
jgi:homoserine trans-succinylase